MVDEVDGTTGPGSRGEPAPSARAAPLAASVAADAATRHGKDQRIDALGALGLGLVALAMSLYQIDRWSFWHDEVHSADAISLPWPELLAFAQTREINMLTYFALLKVWTFVSMSDAWIRALSALCAALSVVFLFGLTRALFGRQVAWIATALFAINAFLLQYGQEARTYTLATLLAITSTWALIRATRSPTRARWAAYVVLAALIPYTHLIMAGLYPVHALAVLTARPRPSWRLLLVVGLGIAGLIAPALYLAALQQGPVLGWIPEPTLEGLFRGLRRLIGAGGPGPLEALGVAASNKGLPIVIGVLAGIGVLDVVRRRRTTRWAGWVVIAWATIPVLAVLAVSVLKPLFVSRYLIFIIPAIATLVALGIVALPRRSLQVGAFLLALVVTANGAIGWYGSAPRPDWRSAAAWVVARSHADDRAVYIGDFGRVLPYYARQLGAADRIPVGLRHGLDFRADSYPQDLAEMSKNVTAHERVLWVVLTDPPLPAPERDPRLAPLGRVMRLNEVARFNRLVVARYVPR